MLQRRVALRHDHLDAELARWTTRSSAEAVKLPNGSRVYIHAQPSEHEKCVRCWHHREDVGSTCEHPELCGRCVDNVDGDGEQRRYA